MINRTIDGFVGILGSDSEAVGAVTLHINVDVLVAALAGDPIHEPFELTGGVPAVVHILAAATLTLILEIAVERIP